jgi:hypothetical protein
MILERPTPGADPGFKVRGGGGHLKKLRRAEGGAKSLGVFRVKNHDLTPKNHIFSNFREGAPGAPPGFQCILFKLTANILQFYTLYSFVKVESKYAMRCFRDTFVAKLTGMTILTANTSAVVYLAAYSQNFLS